jgi:hypothetical protein
MMLNSTRKSEECDDRENDTKSMRHTIHNLLEHQITFQVAFDLPPLLSSAQGGLHFHRSGESDGVDR